MERKKVIAYVVDWIVHIVVGKFLELLVILNKQETDILKHSTIQHIQLENVHNENEKLSINIGNFSYTGRNYEGKRNFTK